MADNSTASIHTESECNREMADDVDENNRTSSSTETENDADLRDKVLRERVESESNLDCSIETVEEDDDDAEEEEEEEEEEDDDEEEDDEESEGEHSQRDGNEEREDGELSEEEEEDEDGKETPTKDILEKRHMGDGEEQEEEKVEKSLDDDEDKSNPAYIPRKGAFFEHDTRLDDDDCETTEKKKDEKSTKKKLWIEELKWQHDLFNAKMQAPKTKQELVDIYGYDIRTNGDRDVPLNRGQRKRGGGPRGRSFGDYINDSVRTNDETVSDYPDENRSMRGYRGGRRGGGRGRGRRNDENRGYERLNRERNNSDSEYRSDFPPLKENVRQTKSFNRRSDVEDKHEKRRNNENETSPGIIENAKAETSRSNRNIDNNTVQENKRQEDEISPGNRKREPTDHRDLDRGMERVSKVVVDNKDESNQQFEGRATRDVPPRFDRGPRSYQRDRYGYGDRQDDRVEEYKGNEREENGFREAERKPTSERHEYRNSQYQSRNRGGERDDYQGSQRNDRPGETRYRNAYDNDDDGVGFHGNQGQRGQTTHPTRTIQNRNNSVEHNFSNYRGRDNDKQQVLESVSNAMKRMVLNDKEAVDRQPRRGNHRGNSYSGNNVGGYRDENRTNSYREDNCTNSYRDENRTNSYRDENRTNSYRDENRTNSYHDENRTNSYRDANSSNGYRDANRSRYDYEGRRGDGNQGQGRTEAVRPERFQNRNEEKEVRSVEKRRQDERNVQKKSNVVIQTTDIPEMIPPVTSIQTYAKTLATDARPSSNQGWAGGEFTPGWRVQTSAPSMAKGETAIVSTQSLKPKRYSTQRQRTGGVDAVYGDTANVEYGTSGSAVQQSLSPPITASLPTRQLQTPTYYDVPSSYSGSPFPPAPTLGIPNMPFPIPGTSPHGLYTTPPNVNGPQVPKPGTPIHNLYMQTPSMMQGHYMTVPMNYAPQMNPTQYQMGPPMQQVSSTVNHSSHIHNPMQEQDPVDMHHHRLIYYNHPAIQMPLVHHQYMDQSGYINDSSSHVDHTMAGQPNYAESQEINPPVQPQCDY